MASFDPAATRPNTFLSHANALIENGQWDEVRAYQYLTETRDAIRSQNKDMLAQFGGRLGSCTFFRTQLLAAATDARKAFAAEHGHFIRPFH